MIGLVGPSSGILRKIILNIATSTKIIKLTNKSFFVRGSCSSEMTSFKCCFCSSKFRFSSDILSDNPQTKYRHFFQQETFSCNIGSEIKKSFFRF